MIFLIIFLIALSIACAIANCVTSDLTNSVFWTMSLIINIAVLSIVIDEPKPIDVYRNKTTLEVTYRDGVAIDSTVVFKTHNNL